MNLLKPFWLREYPAGTIKQRTRAMDEIHKWCGKIAEMDDEEQLIEIARNAVYESYRRAAEKRIEDQSVLRELAQKYHDKEAIVKLAGAEDILREVALEDEDNDTVEAAVRGISDDAFLKELLEKAVRGELPCEACDRKNNAHPAIIRDITMQIADEAYLFQLAAGKIFREGFYRQDRVVAADKIEDEEKLYSLAKTNGIDDDVAKTAISRMHNLEHLEWIRDHLNAGGVYPTRGMVAADRIKRLAKQDR